MPISVVMPALEMGQETGKLVAWLKKDGDRVTKGEPLLEVETDKAVLEVEATGDGTLAGVKAQEGDVIPVGQTIAWILGPGEQIPFEAGTANISAAPPAAISAQSSTNRTQESSASSSSQISPKARRLAKEHGIDLNTVRGTGAGGEILASDIQALVDSKIDPKPKSAPATSKSLGLEPVSTVSRLMAERTTQSWTTVPHFFLTRDIDASALVAAREDATKNGERSDGVKLTHTDFLVALAARALTKHPRMNASWTGDGVRLNSEINIAIAMAVADGVVTAVIRNADSIKLNEIAIQRRDLTERARAGKLRAADITGATFTISNLGMYQIDSFSAIIIPPQAGILAVGQIADRVVAIDGKAGIRSTMTVTLSCDHRVIDGAQAALFLKDLAESIAAPGMANLL
ncbi:MAG TPA: dihydrolipoamide acetyltransferase family protein [Terriglobales bacterium]|nr:dihydrolipoamide acetyltransferase family protein [Terriglobales bacterium]